MQSISRVYGRHYLAMFVLASATLSYQILITRFFSVILYYHFAFAAISLAMLGLTRGRDGGLRQARTLCARTGGFEFARHAFLFALSSVGAMISFLCAPFLPSARTYTIVLAVAIIAFVWPFTEGGVCITLLLSCLQYSGGWLYATDLLGAARRMPRNDRRIAGDHRRQRRVVDRGTRGRGWLDRWDGTA